MPRRHTRRLPTAPILLAAPFTRGFSKIRATFLSVGLTPVRGERAATLSRNVYPGALPVLCGLSSPGAPGPPSPGSCSPLGGPATDGCAIWETMPAENGVEVPHVHLTPEALRSLVEEFVTRDGTDYGRVEKTLDEKVAAVMRQLDRGEVAILYDGENQTTSIARRPVRRSRSGWLGTA